MVDETQKTLELVVNNLAVISGQMAQMIGSNTKPITDGSTRIPYQELTFTLAAGARTEIFQVFNYFRVMSMSASTLSVRLGQNGLETPFTAAGVGIDLEDTLTRITLINTGGVSMTITVALAMGRVNDDRLNVSGTVNTSETDASRTGATIANSAASATTVVSTVSVASATKRQVIIKNISGSAATAFIGTATVTASNGQELLAGESITLETSAAVGAITSAGTASLRVTEIFN